MSNEVVVEGAVAKSIYHKCYNPDIMPLSYAPWLLDEALKDNWNLVGVMEENNLKAFMIYEQQLTKRKQRIEPIIPFFQESPLWISSLHEWNSHVRVTKEHEWLNRLLEKIPAYDHFSIHLPSELWSWLPFYWNGFEQSTSYVFELSLHSPPESMKSGEQISVRPVDLDSEEGKRLENRFARIHHNINWLRTAQAKQQLMALMATNASGYILAASLVMYNHSAAYEWYQSDLQGQLENEELVRKEMLLALKKQLHGKARRLRLSQPKDQKEQFMYRLSGAIPVRQMIIEHTPSPLLNLKRIFDWRVVR